jgi:hypothetical protein
MSLSARVERLEGWLLAIAPASPDPFRAAVALLVPALLALRPLHELGPVANRIAARVTTADDEALLEALPAGPLAAAGYEPEAFIEMVARLDRAA